MDRGGKKRKKPFDWCRKIIYGAGGMNDYQKYELVIWNEPIRVAAARWAIKCLANPDCEGSEEALSEVITRRRALLDAKKSGQR